MISLLAPLVQMSLYAIGIPVFDRTWLPLPLTGAEVAMAYTPGAVVIEQIAGDGEAVQPGDRATFHFVVMDDTSKVLADSRKRGLPFSVELSIEQMWMKFTLAMLPGEKRLIYVPASEAFGLPGRSGLIPPNTDLWLELDLISVQRTKRPMPR